MAQIRKFDTQVQYLKYKVLREVARRAFAGNLTETISEIPKVIVPGTKPTMRCCVYKERAIVLDRVQLALGGDKTNPNVIEVIKTACDECPLGGYTVTDACRGCIAHRCEDACKRGAIYFDRNQKAHIDKDKCVECGMCAKVCPYSAISNNKRPCERACKVKAIGMDDDKAAKIDNSKCIACGACVYQCPFGAIVEKSFILDVINMLKQSEKGSCKVYALIAPAIASQFSYAKLGQVLTGIRKLGFDGIEEAAKGADMVAYSESQELAQSEDFVTSSCCPAFVSYIEKTFPQLKDHISHNLSPMATIAKHMKEKDPKCKIVFIGPCTAKKLEIQKPEVKGYVDSAITFEELQALFDGRDIDISTLEEEGLNTASYYGRIFARSCGLTEAVAEGLKEHEINFDYRPVTCDGIDECRIALLKASKGALNGNFIEGMACVGGCIGGAGCLEHGEKNKAHIDKYGNQAHEKTITDSINNL